MTEKLNLEKPNEIQETIQETPSPENKEKKLENEVFVGSKPFMKYVIATMIQLQKKENASTIIKARGKFISRAVDIAEVAKKRMKENNNLTLNEEVKIGTDSFKNQEGKDINVSTISVILTK
ncbi:MAG: RNA-binding protein [Nanoarchaeota archaeon]|nr:RNA-binding protein [Nanoarchaeota archaeon]